jgi:hypothetical protein
MAGATLSVCLCEEPSDERPYAPLPRLHLTSKITSCVNVDVVM